MVVVCASQPAHHHGGLRRSPIVNFLTAGPETVLHHHKGIAHEISFSSIINAAKALV
jgi:hypothetical protein